VALLMSQHSEKYLNTRFNWHFYVMFFTLFGIVQVFFGYLNETMVAY